MNRRHDDLSSPAQIIILGPESGDESIHLTNSHFALEFLKLLSSCDNTNHVTYDSRYRAVTSVLPNSDLASSIAADGFIVIAGDEGCASSLVCVCSICKAEASPFDRRRQHKPNCQYRRLQQFCDGSLVPSANDADTMKRLIDHIKRESTKTKAQVAREFGFSRDLVCALFAQQFVSGRDAFESAGDLVNALIEFEEKTFQVKIDPEHVCRGFSQFVDNYHSRKMPSLRQASLKGAGPSTTKEDEDHDTLLKETRTLMMQMFCKLCCKSNAEYVLLECGHLSLCHGCSKKTSDCPVCGEGITELIRTFIA